VFDFSAVGLQGYGPTNEGNFKPPVDTLAILTEKFQALRSTVNNLRRPLLVSRQDNRVRWCSGTAGLQGNTAWGMVLQALQGADATNRQGKYEKKW
jgi:hypothetical protein